ncbi:hypothetical protein [Runella rosea]|uniref:hypothetical protein n=1 Tax=Runella rosea TaxID=2259595 RepID=UPI0013B41039|nr:hypothetical protein [Runella rosea]
MLQTLSFILGSKCGTLRTTWGLCWADLGGMYLGAYRVENALFILVRSVKHSE